MGLLDGRMVRWLRGYEGGGGGGITGQVKSKRRKDKDLLIIPASLTTRSSTY